MGCGNAAPESGLYINSLPGISLESIDKLAKAEQSTYVQVWQDVQTRALQKFEHSAISEFAKRYRKKSLRQSIDISKIADLVNQQSAPIAQFRGFSVETIFKMNAPFTISNLQGLSWQSLSLYLKAIPTNPIVLNIYDMDSGETLWTKTINNTINPVNIGWNNILVNQVFMNKFRLFAGYDATEIDAPLLNMNVNYLSSTFGGCASFMWGCSCEGFIRGSQTIVNSDPTLVSYGGNSYGLSGIFSIICSFEPLICNNKRLFDDALWYFLGAEMMIERMYSSRWNWWTLTKEEAQSLYKLFQSEGEGNLQLAVDGIDLDQRDGCIECNEQVTLREATP